MAILTTRQKQQLIGPVLLFLLIGGFLGGLWQGNPIAITILVILVLGTALVIWLRVSLKRAARADREEKRHVRSDAAHPLSPGAAAAIEKINRLSAPKAEPVTVSFQIPVMSDDTLDSLTVRVMEQYADRGGTIPVAEAKAMAAKALAEHQQG